MENLKSATGVEFHHLNAAFPNATPVQLALLKQKGVYPYDWMNSAEKLELATLPPQKSFDSELRNEACSDEDYKRAQEVWKEFRFEKFLNYHEHYLKSIFCFFFLTQPLF